MKRYVVGLALILSLIGAPALSNANPQTIGVKPIKEGDFFVDVEGSNVKFGKFKFWKLEDGGHEWDYGEYTPYCNSKLGHPFYKMDKMKDEIVFYNPSGKEIERMTFRETNELPPLWLYQAHHYKCSNLEHVNPKMRM